jgi:hypothetical protein
MASFPDVMRQSASSAESEGRRVHRHRRLVISLVALSIAAIGSTVATFELATLQRDEMVPTHAPTFLTRALGVREPSRSLVSTPAPDVQVAVHGGGFTIVTPDGTLGLSSDSTGSGWTAYRHGAVRSTPTGPETITVAPDVTEQYRTIRKHHGITTWRWRLDTTLEPRSSPNGFVGFFDGTRLTSLALKPVAILDRRGRNITPAGLHWQVVRGRGKSWLDLTLDDRKLTVPYTIDPATYRTDAQGSSASTASFTITEPGTVVADDLLVLVEMSTAVSSTTNPTTPTDTSGGSTWSAAAANAVGYSGGPQATKKLSAQIFYKFATATDAGATVTATPFASSTNTIGSIYAFRGVDSTQAPLTALTSNAPGSLTTSSCPAVTPASAATQNLICAMTGRVNGSYSGATGMAPWTYRGDSASTLTTASDAIFNDDPVSSTTPITAKTSTSTVYTGGAYQLSLAMGFADDVSAPSAPTGFTASALTQAAQGTGAFAGDLYFKSGGTGGFTLTGTGAADSQSGIQSYTYPALTGFTQVGNAYTFTGTATGTTGSITATNNANLPSATGFTATLVPDGTAPAGGAFTANGTAASAGGTTSWLNSGTTLTINSRNDYAETQSAGQSGLATSALTIATGTLSNNTCSAYGAPAPITGTTSQTVASGNCYLLTLTGTDKVGNATSISTTVKVDTTAPGNATGTAPTGFTASSLTQAFQGSGAFANTVYFKNGGTGGFTITGSGATDPESNVAGYTYPSLTGFTGTGTYTFAGTTAGTTGSLTATNNAGLTSSGLTVTLASDGTAPTGGAITVNGGAAYLTSGTTLTINSRTDYTETQSATASGLASSTLTIQQGTLAGNSCSAYGGPATITGTTAQTVSTGHCYLLTLTGTDNVGNTTSTATTVKVDTTAPSAPTAISTSALTNAFQGSGAQASVVFFKSGSAGGFTVTASGAGDAETGVPSYTYPSLTGFAGTGTYTFTGTSTTQTGSVTSTNGAGVASTTGYSFTAQADNTPPTGGAITVNGGATYLNTGSSVSISTTNYAEAQSATASGLASNALTVQQGTLSGNSCTGFGGPTDITGQSTYTVSTAHCYLFTLTGTDNVGNAATTTAVVKVDTTDPGAPALSFSGLTQSYYPGSGTKVYFKSGGNGGFTVTPSSTDGGSGISSYSFPLVTGFGNTAGAYTFSGANATASGSITATSNAGRTGAGTTFTAQADSTAPSGGALTLNSGATYVTSGTTVAITRTDYTETQTATESGLASSTLTYETAPLNNNTCGSFVAGSTVTGTTSPTLSDATCYRFTLTGTDHVGNSVSIVRTIDVDETPAQAPTGISVSALSNAYYPGSGTKVYFKNGATGGFTVTASGATDTETAIAGYTYPSLTGFTGTGAYAFNGSSTTQSGNVTANNNAGTPGGGTLAITAQADSTAPSGGALTLNSGATYVTSGTTVTVSTTDFAETQSTTESGIASNVLTVQQGTLGNGTCSGYGGTTDITGQTSYTVSSGHCYLFTLTGADHVGNAAVTNATVKVDTDAPGAPALAFSGLSNAYYPGSGAKVYFRSGAAGGFTVTPSSTDGGSGISSYSYPSLTGLNNVAGAYTFDPSSATQSGPITATNNAGATGPGTSFTAQADATSPTGGALTVNGGGAYVTSGTSVAISTTSFAEAQSATESGLASNAVTVKVGTLSHDTCTGYGSATDITGQSSYTVSGAACYEFTLTGTDNVGNAATDVETVKVDTSAPSAPSLSYSSFTNAYANGNTVYFKGGSIGGFTLTPTSTDAETDVASYGYPALTGFAHTNGAYTFDGSSTTESGSVTATNKAGATGSGTTFTAQADSTAPTGGALTVNGGATYLASGTSVSISSTDFAETQSPTESGIADNVLTVQQATLSGNNCQTYGSTTDITGQSSYTVASGTCYLFTLTGSDRVGNAASVSATVKVDTTAPSAPSAISIGGETKAYYPGTGTIVYFKGGDTGGFTVTGSGATDGDSSVASYVYSGLTGFGGIGSYTFNASSTTQTGSVAATNGAGVTGSGLAFTAQSDASAPTGGALVVNGGSAWIGAGTTLTIDTRTDYSETQSATESGLASSTLTIEEGTLSSGSCIAYGAPTTIFGTTSQTVQDGHCYRLTLTGLDNVGNTASIQREVKVDYTGPSAPTLSFGALTNAYASANTVYFQGATSGGFTLTPSSTDSNSGVASYSYPTLSGFSNTGGAYAFDASSTTQSGNVTATNNAGATSAPTTFIAQVDTAAPTGGALVVNGGSGYLTSGTTLSIDTRTDFTETQSATDSGLASSTLTIQSATLAGNSCGAYGSPTTIVGTASQTVAGGNCYLLTLTGTDHVGNTTSLVRVVKVDTTAPAAPSTLSFGNLTNAHASGTTVYFKSGTTGAFTVTGSGATDSDTGIASYAYPSLTGFGGSGGSYTFDGSSTTQTGSVTATNGAGTAGAGKAFTAQADGGAPTSSVTCNGSACPGGWTSSAPVDIAINASDGGSGVQNVTYTTDGSDPTSSGTATTVAGASATFQISSATTIRWLASDNVDNASAPQSLDIQIDTTAPTAPTAFAVSGTTHAFFDGDHTVFFQGGGTGGFTLTASGAADPQSGIDHYDYPALSGFGGSGGAYTFDGSSTTQTGSVTATNNATSVGPGKSFTAQSDSSAPTSSIACNGAPCAASWYTTSPVHVAISASDSGAGVESVTYTTDGSNPASSATGTTVSASAVALDVATLGTTTVKWMATDEVGNVSSAGSQDVELDTTAPNAPSLSFSGLTNAYAAGNTVYFKAGTTGGFSVTPASADAQSGVASFAYPSLTGFANTGGDYTFDSSSTTESGDVTATDGAGLTSAATTFTAQADSTGPSGGDVIVNGGAAYATSGPSVSVSVTNYAEAQTTTQSGLAGNTLTVETGTLAGDGCTAYGAPVDITGAGSQNVSGGHCYRFTLTGTDHVGNATSTQAVVKVDTTAPTSLALAFANAGGGAYYPGSGSIVYFDPSSAGHVDVTASASDPETNVAYGFPAVGGTWSPSGAGATRTYSYTSPAGAGGTETVTATNGAGSASTADFELTADTAAPITTAQCNGSACGSGWFTSAPVQLTLDASDGGSGIQQTRYTTDGSTPTPVSGTAYAGAIDVFATTTFTFRSWDNVGNAEAPVTLTIQVDASAPALPALSLSESSPNEAVTGTTLYYNPSGSNAAAFTVGSSPSDGESGVAKVTFPSLGGMAGGGDVTSAPYEATYSWDNTATTEPGSVTVTARNAAGLTTSRGFTVTKDVTAPSGTSITYAAGFNTSGSVTFTTGDGADGGSGLDSSSAVVERATRPLANGVCTGSWSSWSTIGSSPDSVPTGTCAQYRYRISDNVGNEQVATGGVVEVDTTAPTTTFSSTPTDPSATASPSFSFNADESSTFECKVDGGSFASCSTGLVLGPLAEGSHTFQVRATDLAGNTGATVSHTWFTDLTAPAVSLTAPSSGAYLSGSVAVTANASDNHDASPAVDLEADVAGTWTSIGSPWDTTPLGDGSYDLRATATDAAGNSTTSATVTVSIDNHAPSITFGAPGQYINAAAPASVPLTVTSLDSDIASVQFYECSTSSPTCAGGTWNAVGSPVTSSPWTTSWTVPGADGLEAVKAVATDAASNTGTATTTTLIDRTAPSGTSITYGAGYDTSGSVAFTTSDGSDGGSGLDSPTAVVERATESLANGVCSGGWSSWSTVSGSPDSVPTNTCVQYRYRISDQAGNEQVATGGIVKSDSTTPDTTIATKPSNPSNVAGPTFSFSADETADHFECRIDGGSWSTCASPYTFGFSLGQGSHTFDVRGYDLAGNVDATPASYAWTVDTVPPAASMTSPGAHIRGTVGLSSTSTDSPGTGVASESFEYSSDGGNTWTAIPGSSWDTTARADGSYQLHVVATDNAGNVATSTALSLIVDNTAPSVAITNPLTNSGVAGSVLLTASITDADASPTVVWSYRLSSDSTWTALPGSTWNTIGLALPDGQYDVKAAATDWAGNQQTDTQTNVTVDNQPPTTSVTAPADGSYLNAAASDPYTLTADANDKGTGVKQVDFYACTDVTCSSRTLVGTDPTGSAGHYSTAWNLPGDGITWIEAVATDNVGHTRDSIVSVTVDRTLPDTTIDTKPADPSNAASPAFTFHASESAQRFECRLDGGSWTTCGSPHALASAPADGSHTMQIRAVDLAGNTDGSPASWTWLEDTTKPTVTLTDPAAANASHAIRATVALASVANDPGANASGLNTTTYEYSVHGANTWVAIASPAAWDTTAIDDGLYDVRVTVTDHAGNASDPSVVSGIKIDNTLPETATDDPGQYLRGTIHLTGTSVDPKHPGDPAGSGVSGLDHVDFQVSQTGANSWTTIGTDSTGPFDTVSYDYDTLGAHLTDGYYDFRTVAYDVAGNTQAATTFAVNHLVDNTPPTVALTDPGTNLHGTVTLNDTANDPAPASGVASTLFEISPAGANTWSPVGSSFNTTGVSDGLYDFRVSVTDRSGNLSAYSSVAGRLIDNTPPGTTASGVPAGYSATDVTVTLSPADAGSGVSDTLYEVDGGAAQHGTSILIPAPSNGSNDGTHTVSFQSVDAAGNVETPHSVTVKIDATPPSCPSCSAADYMRGTVTLSAAPSSLSGIHDVEFFYRTHPSGTWTSIGDDATGTGGTYSSAWNTTGVADGYYDLRYTVTSNSGATQNYDLSSKVVDNTAPTVSVGAPVSGARVGGTVTISATSSDANALTYDFLVNGSAVASGAAASASWDSTSVADGPVSVAVRATDPAGNSTTSAAVSITADNHAPSPTVDDPGAAVSGSPTLGVTTDGDTANVELDARKQGASTWVTIGTVGPPFNQTWNTTGLTDGAYELRAVATDLAGHVGTSPTITTVVDNTAPTGSLTTPTAASTIGGPHTPLVATAADGGSGVAGVTFGYYDGTAWNTISTVTSAPYETTWNAQAAVATGTYLLHAIIIDAAGNTKTTSSVSVNVDSSAPTVTLANPGASLSGTVPLTATTSGPDAVAVTFAYSVHGANAWQTIRTDSASPWSASFDTTSLTDGSYDLRATAVDGVGNIGTSAVYTALIDNKLPTIAHGTPGDGSTVTAATAIALDLSETATLSAITLDGGPTVAPTVTGTHVDFPTGALASGAHVLDLTLTDLTGKTADAQLRFTVYDASSGGTPPPVEADTLSTAPATTIDSADGSWSLTVPAGAMPAGSSPNTWVVVRLAPTTPSRVPPVPAGMAMQRVVEILARWVDGSGELHSFSTPLDIAFKDGTGVIPATAEVGGSWRMIPHLDAASLPAGQPDGYYRDGTTLHVLTHHLTLFGLVVDTAPPSPPHDFNATVNDGNLYLRWSPADAGGGPIAGYTVYVDGVSTKSLGNSEYQYEVGPYDPADNHAYAVVALDGDGHTSAATPTLKLVPLVFGMQLDAARAALAAKGFAPGDVTVVGSDQPAGTVVGPDQPVSAEAGATIPLQVSAGPGAPATKFVFSVVGTKRLVLSQRKFIGIHIAATRSSVGTATLLSAKGTVLKTWPVKAHAGVSIVKLAVPKVARKKGVYRLRWKATSGADAVTETIVVRIGKTRKDFAKASAPVDVLVAGASVPAKLPLVDPASRQMSADSENTAFALAGDPRHNVQVIIVDADQYTLSMIHDLHTVFPTIKVVALSNDPRRLAAAVRAGATLGLPKTTPATKLAKVVGSISTTPRPPASRRR